MSSEILQHQIAISLRSSFTAEITSLSLLAGNLRKSLVSSTQSGSPCFETRKRSFTYNINNTGPMMDPRGTPTVRGKGSDTVFWNLTTWWRCDKQLSNQARADSDTPALWSLRNIRSCRRLSKGLDMSKRTIIDIFFRSMLLRNSSGKWCRLGWVKFSISTLQVMYDIVWIEETGKLQVSRSFAYLR